MQKQFFNKYLVIVSLSFFLALILSYITAVNAFPLGEDLAGGTQLIYKLDESEVEHDISMLTRQLKDAEAMPVQDATLIKSLQQELDARRSSLTSSRGNVAYIINKRVDPTGTKNVHCEMIDNDSKLRVSMPSASPLLLQQVEQRIQTQGHLTIHHVLNPDGNIGSPGKLYADLYKAIENAVQQEYGPKMTVAEAFHRANPLLAKTPALKIAAEAKVAEWETHWMAIMKAVNAELFDADGKYLYVVNYENPSEYGESKQVTESTTAWQRDQLILDRNASVKGSDIESASWTTLGDKGPAVNIRFTTAGARTFGEATTKWCSPPFTAGKERMAIVLDGWSRSAPTVEEPILGGGCEISGAMDSSEAQRVSGVLNAGSLSFLLTEESKTTTGPTLGHEAIQQGMWAILFGAILVVFFMLAYYRRAGTIACMALFFNLIMLLGTMCFIKATLTLPGIAGILLTIGMAVDANVLIYERIREEIAKGRTIRAAVDQGFERAFVTIVDANITTLIIGIVLYYMGSGPVKGFAMTLSLGILTSLFAGIFITRTLMETYILRNTPGGGRGALITYLIFNLLAAFYFYGSAHTNMVLAFGDSRIPADTVFGGVIALVGFATFLFVLRSKDDGKSQRFMSTALVTTGLLCSVAFFLYMGPETQMGKAVPGVTPIRLIHPLLFAEDGATQWLRIGLMIVAPLIFIAVAAVSQIYSRGDWSGLTMADWFKFKKDIDIMKWRHKFITMSLILNACGVLAFILVQGTIYDTDFTGGTELIVNTRKQQSIDTVRKDLGDLQKYILDNVQAQETQIQDVIADIPVTPGGVQADLDAPVDIAHWITTKPQTAEEFKRSPKILLPEELAQAALTKFNTKGKLIQQLLLMESEKSKVQDEKFEAVAYGTSKQSFQINTGINSLLMQNLFDTAVHTKLAPILQYDSIYIDGNDLNFRFVPYNSKEDGEAGSDAQLLQDMKQAVDEISHRYASQPAVQKALAGLIIPTQITTTDFGGTSRSECDATISAPSFPIANPPPGVAADFKPYAEEIKAQFSQSTGAQLRVASNWRESLTIVDSSISTGTKISALVALILSMAAICVYVWIRFDFIFGYGLGAILSLLHDVAVTLLVYSIASKVLDVKMNMDAVAAILTLVGYSINDTIVVFDRVREERRAHRTRDILRVMNESINRTLSRTILTSGTTILAVSALLFLGGQSLLGLSIILFIGIITGTYSSIYIACPFVHWWISRKGGKGSLEHGNLVVTAGAGAGK
ncbi:MAG: protein translocase subunit SecD [Planctomycetota bacterium]